MFQKLNIIFQVNLDTLEMSSFLNVLAGAIVAAGTVFLGKAFIEKEYYGTAFMTFWIGINAASGVFTYTHGKGTGTSNISDTTHISINASETPN